MQIDTTTPFGARVLRRLREDRLIWLTTVRPNGQPEPSPVWFFWEGETVLIYSRPNNQKLRDIAANPHVALNFDGDGQGGDIVILTGQAEIVPDAPSADQVAAYASKYEWGFERVKLTAKAYAEAYSVAIRVHPTKLRGHE
jgi:PPOX class probable F420-dependent enzyme